MAILECEIINKCCKEKLIFAWTKNGEIIDLDKENGKYEYVIDDNKYKLIIKDFQDDDVSEYSIFLTQPADFEISSSALIEINGIIYILV
jgi:hypothetical protein